MAGYVINLNDPDAVARYAALGAYGTVMKNPVGRRWLTHHEGTFADYASMKPGDNVYFFSDRRIYGIGTLVSVGGACAHQNFPSASSTPWPVDPNSVRRRILLDAEPASTQIRWICTFAPSPAFYRVGVDMDDALVYRPNAFKMLRSFWKRSFIKVDDEENQALADVVLRAGSRSVATGVVDYAFDHDHEATHARISRRLTRGHRLSARNIANLARSGSQLTHEMALEASLALQLAKMDQHTTSIFGNWDYVTHQLVASPPKPPDYNDWIDLFGYSFLPGAKTIGTFHVAEIKKDEASARDVLQVMKYVDFIKDEYCYGDYSLIRAYLVASAFSADVQDAVRSNGKRFYTVGRRPPATRTWGNGSELALVEYRVDAHGSIRFRRRKLTP